MTCSRSWVVRRATLIALLCAAAPTAVGAQVLRPTDSIAVREDNGVIVNRVVAVAARGGRTFIGDGGESRVLEIGPRGNIVRVFGRKGRGPGELLSPGALAVGGDTALFVLDAGQRRLSVFDLRTGAFVRGFPVTGPMGFAPSLVVSGPALLVPQMDEPTKTSIATLSDSGTVGSREGPLPPIGERHPILLGSHPMAAYTVSGRDVYAIYALSPALHHWTRGSRTGETISLPVRSRRGVSEARYDALIRDPSRARELMYDHSFPADVGVIAPGMVVLVTFDPTLGNKGTWSGPHHVTLVDVARRRVCPDAEVPVPREPLPRVALDGRTLVAVYQAVSADGDAATIIRRFTMQPTACDWVAVK